MNCKFHLLRVHTVRASGAKAETNAGRGPLCRSENPRAIGAEPEELLRQRAHGESAIFTFEQRIGQRLQFEKIQRTIPQVRCFPVTGRVDASHMLLRSIGKKNS